VFLGASCHRLGLENLALGRFVVPFSLPW